MKVLLITNIPSPYMISYLDELGKYCELTAVFELQSALDREKEWYGNVDRRNFEYAFLNAVRFSDESGLSLKILPYLAKNKFERIIIANPTTPTGIAALLYCRWCHIPFIIQSEGGFQGTGKGFKECIKKYIMEKAEYYLTGMGGEYDYFLAYGGTRDRLKPYPFTSLKQNELEKEPIGIEKKAALRNELGIADCPLILSVGRVIHEKGFDLLVKAAAKLKGKANVMIVGGVPNPDISELMTGYAIDNVEFVGFSTPEIVKKYYMASDIFVLPTRRDTWGLVINEAMANGLPVVTTNMCIAGTQLIENDVNGYIVPTDNTDALTKALLTLLGDKNLCAEMAENNLAKIAVYSLENMAKVIYSHLEES